MPPVALDESDRWSTNPDLRKACLLQLHDAIEGELRGAAGGADPEVRLPARSPMARSWTRRCGTV